MTDLLTTDIANPEPLFPEQTEDAILARMETWANEGIDPSTQPDLWVDVREGGHWRLAAVPTAREVARLYDLAGTEVLASGMIAYTWGSYLDAQGLVFNIDRLAATAAEGVVHFVGPAGTAIGVGTEVSVDPVNPDDAAPAFQTDSGGTIPAAAAAPVGLAGVPHSTGGTLPAGHRFYVVTAYDAAGETTASAQIDVNVPAGGTGSVDLSWTAVPTAVGYRVYEGATGGPYSLIVSVSANAYTDTGTPAPDGVTHPPGVNTTGGALDLSVTATVAGSSGEVAANAIRALNSPIAGVTVSNPAATTGGTDPETDEALRGRIIAFFSGDSGPGNTHDYQQRAGGYAGVGRVTVIPNWNGPNTVKVILTTSEGQPVAPSVVAFAENDLDPVAGQGAGWAPVGAIVTVTTATLLPITVAATVEFEPGFSLDGFGGTVEMQSLIDAALAGYVNRVESGGEVVVAQVEGRIATLNGVHDVAGVLVNGGAVNVPIPSDPAQVPSLTVPTSITEGTL